MRNKERVQLLVMFLTGETTKEDKEIGDPAAAVLLEQVIAQLLALGYKPPAVKDHMKKIKVANSVKDKTDDDDATEKKMQEILQQSLLRLLGNATGLPAGMSQPQ